MRKLPTTCWTHTRLLRCDVGRLFIMQIHYCALWSADIQNQKHFSLIQFSFISISLLRRGGGRQNEAGAVRGSRWKRKPVLIWVTPERAITDDSPPYLCVCMVKKHNCVVLTWSLVCWSYELSTDGDLRAKLFVVVVVLMLSPEPS